ncbi:adenylyltransferase and sulfurtransferase MOCS3-like [Lineus longissimus]|uniref:adenylyltransferase and sulfurtransferase MOCS3-like n=1 Tax=Lineus longissimus TaxID=88925 RepID=UPI002B4FA877
MEDRAQNLQLEINNLRKQLAEKTVELEKLTGLGNGVVEPKLTFGRLSGDEVLPKLDVKKLDNRSIARHSRQLILPELGVRGQLKLASTSVLIVGAGGLGCPCALYLAAGGIGRIGFVDYDEVELGNLHRQVLHTEERIGISKSTSAATACNQLNSDIKYMPYHLQLDSTNAIGLISQYDIIVDATDNVATRYLLNDACVLAKKPLVSGSALRLEGQLTVYNYLNGPCYRCLYPKPPPPKMVTNCSDGGVLGVVPGIIGCIQAMEVMKIAAGFGTTYSQRLLLFDAIDCVFRTIKLRPRQKNCVVCGETPSITRLIDYEQFCGARASDKERSLSLLSPDERISVEDYKRIKDTGVNHVLVDVRLPVELDICKLEENINIPITNIHDKETVLSSCETKISEYEPSHENPLPVYVVCRRGNDSQSAVKALQEHLKDLPVVIKDIRGGLTAWARKIDNDFPQY